MERALQQRRQDSLAEECVAVPSTIVGKSSESTSTKEPGICAQSLGAGPVDVNSYGSVMLQNTTKSSAGDELSMFSTPIQFCKNVYRGIFHQKEPKKTGAVVTLQDLIKSVPTIRVKLENKTKAKQPCEPVLMLDVKECVDGMFRKAEENLQLEHKPAKEALERNQKKLDAIFDSIEQRIRKMAEDVKIKFISLPLEQQREFLVFWNAAQEILRIVLDWLCQVFSVVLAKIREGYVIEKDVLREVFKMGAAKLNELYFETVNKFIE